MLPVLFGVIMAIIDIVMMSTTKMISLGKLPAWWGTPLAVGLYALEPLIFLKSLNYESMIVMNLIWDLTSDVIVTMQGVFVFGESIKGLRWLGILLSLISIGILSSTKD